MGIGQVIVCMMLLTSSAAAAQVGFAEDLQDEIESVVGRFHSDGGFHGQVLVSVGDSVVVDGAWGVASHELELPLTANHRLLLASVSKSFTAAAILRLVDRGSVELDAPALQYLPESGIDPRITIHQLLTHTSGLARDLLPGTGRTRREHFPTRERVELALSHGLRFDPGSGYAYSSCGYVVLGAILEAVTGRRLDAALDELVFAPLDMRSAGLEMDGVLVPARAGRYDRLLGDVVPAPFEDPSFAWGSGSVSATARDVWKFARGLLAPEFLSDEARASVWRDHQDGQGYGVRPFPYSTGERLISSGGTGFGYDGGTAGVAAVFNVLIDHETVVVVLANHTPFQLNALSNSVMNLALGYLPSTVTPPNTASFWDAFAVGGAAGAAAEARKLQETGPSGAIPSAGEVFRVAFGLYQHHRLNEAEAVVRMLLDRSPSEAAWTLLGNVEVGHGDRGAACDAFAEANALRSSGPVLGWTTHCEPPQEQDAPIPRR